MRWDKIKKAILISILGFVFVRCTDRYIVLDNQTISIDKVKRADDTVLVDSVGRFRFSRLSRLNSFGMGANYTLPEKSRGKDIWVIVGGRTRTNYAQSNAVIAVVTHKGEQQTSWMVVPLKYDYTSPDTWCSFRDSLKLGEKIDGKEYDQISIAAHLPGSTQENFDLETLHMIIKQIR